MKNAIDAIRQNALSLSASERASLAHDLILSLDNDENFYLGKEYEKEIQRRVAAVKEGNASSSSVDEVFDGIEKRYNK